MSTRQARNALVRASPGRTCASSVRRPTLRSPNGPNGDAKSAAATLSGLDILEPLQATLRMIGKLTREHAVDVEDKQTVLAAGASRHQIEDAFAVCFSFNVIGRLADAFGFVVPGPEALEAARNTSSCAATAERTRQISGRRPSPDRLVLGSFSHCKGN